MRTLRDILIASVLDNSGVAIANEADDARNFLRVSIVFSYAGCPWYRGNQTGSSSYAKRTRITRWRYCGRETMARTGPPGALELSV